MASQAIQAWGWKSLSRAGRVILGSRVYGQWWRDGREANQKLEVKCKLGC